MDALKIHNQKLIEETKLKIAAQIRQRKACPPAAASSYPLLNLEKRISDAVSIALSQGPLELQFDYIEREKFGGDIAVKIPGLLKNGGPKVFIQKYLPLVVDVLKQPQFADAIAAVEAKGMYVNIKLSDSWFLSAANSTASLNKLFGTNQTLAGRCFVIDYSAPNVAKALHAGHIRSTIIGHVLSNLLEASGALVFRVNHINDFGGFGFILEGYRKFAAYFPDDMSDPQKLVEIYRIRRVFEQIAENTQELSSLEAPLKATLCRYLPAVNNRTEFTIQYHKFIADSDARFQALESGDLVEVELWEKMLAWSLSDFDTFYQSLNIKIDYVLGESFYFHTGNQILEEAKKTGKAIVFTQELADQEIARLNRLLQQEELKTADFEAAVQAAKKDIGALVVCLEEGERFVVQRSDGRSIYATRDLGVIRLRQALFNPSDKIYVVGQEQKQYFSQLFRAAVKLGLCTPDKLRLEHKYFGFYVDAKTGKKLSSRDMVAGVNKLLDAAYQYFYNRVAARGDLQSTELAETAKQLSVGSVVFNDLKQDVKGSVDFELGSLEQVVANFEKSGGAYVVYTACRARSIISKAETENTITGDRDFVADPSEAKMLLTIQRLPKVVAFAAQQSNPSLLVQFLLDLSLQYNSYYNRVRVIGADGKADAARLAITKAVEVCLENGLRFCHVECPEKI